MLKQRVLTALVLIPLVLFGIHASSTLLLSMMVAGLLLLLGSEWCSLIPLNRSTQGPLMVFYVLMLLMLCGGCWHLFDAWLCVGLLLWLGLFVLIWGYPHFKSFWGHRVVVALWGFIELPLFAISLMKLCALPQGRDLFIYLLFLVWAADTGAYFAGKRFGRHRLIPHVSPGKTMEGLLGGCVLSLFVALCGYVWFQPEHGIRWGLLALGVVLISTQGDLFISMLKRRCQLKDTGSLLPGHGGVLDRLDSLIAAVPWFYFGQYFWV